MWRKKLIKVMANGNLCCITSLELNDIRINSGNSPEMFMHIHVWDGDLCECECVTIITQCDTHITKYNRHNN